MQINWQGNSTYRGDGKCIKITISKTEANNTLLRKATHR